MSRPGHPRRKLLAGLGLMPLLLPGRVAYAGSQEEAFLRALREGGCAILIRHALTEPGIGDPPGFSLSLCSSQRQLSTQGREQARRIGRWFAERGLQASRVRSSQWCRCKETADLAFGGHQIWTALNSTFGQAQRQPAQTTELRQALGSLAPTRFEVWVTHQVNMTDLSLAYPAMGEGFALSRDGRLLARLAWA